jgi:hypothetical protein
VNVGTRRSHVFLVSSLRRLPARSRCGSVGSPSTLCTPPFRIPDPAPSSRLRWWLWVFVGGGSVEILVHGVTDPGTHGGWCSHSAAWLCAAPHHCLGPRLTHRVLVTLRRSAHCRRRFPHGSSPCSAFRAPRNTPLRFASRETRTHPPIPPRPSLLPAISPVLPAVALLKCVVGGGVGIVYVKTDPGAHVGWCSIQARVVWRRPPLLI